MRVVHGSNLYILRVSRTRYRHTCRPGYRRGRDHVRAFSQAFPKALRLPIIKTSPAGDVCLPDSRQLAASFFDIKRAHTCHIA